MTRSDRTTRTLATLMGVMTAGTIGAMAPTAAAAQSYDMDCKLILCLPSGFPSGCGDAYRHMTDRLRGGKSPIGFCAQSDGSAYDRYDVQYRFLPADSTAAWTCPAGKKLHHRVGSNDAGTSRQVTTFCYDSAYSYGSEGDVRYTGMTRPERSDFRAKLTLEPGTPAEFTQGWQRFLTGSGRDRSIQIRYSQ